MITFVSRNQKKSNNKFNLIYDLASCASNLGNFWSTSSQVILPMESFLTVSATTSTPILTCEVESLSLRVTVLGSFKLSKSTVIPNGIAISSVLAYLFPMEPELSSTLWETSFITRSWLSLVTRGVKSALFESGRTEHLRGAMTGGRVK